MGRPLRIERAGGWYHITGRGNERKAIFRDDRDRFHFVDLVAEMVARYAVRLHSYQLMDNHYHLIVELREANLSRAGQWLNGGYSRWFNRRHGRSGHLFEGRFKSVVVEPLEWGLALSRYVHLNPVRVRALGLGKGDRQQMRAGLSEAPDRDVVRERMRLLRRNRWSSYRAYVGMERKPDWLEREVILEMLGGSKEERSINYRKYVEQAVREGLSKNPWDHLSEQVVLGGGEFLAKLRKFVKGNRREQPGAQRLAAAHPAFSEVIGAVERLEGRNWLDFRDVRGDNGRDLVLYLGQRVCGMKLVELAASAGMEGYSAVFMAIHRFKRRLEQSGVERERLKQLCQMWNVEI